MGDRGGLGGGEAGLVRGSAGCTATGSLGAGCAGTEPGRGPDATSTAMGAGEVLAKCASLAARLRRRESAASSRARKSSWSLARRASSKLRMLGGMTAREAGAAAAASWVSMWGRVRSPAAAGERWEAGDTEGAGEEAADSKGSSARRAARAKRFATATRRALAACRSFSGGGRASQALRKERRKASGSRSAMLGFNLTAASRSTGNSRSAAEEAAWGPEEGPGGAPPRRGGIQ